MGFENSNSESKKEIPVIPYSETLPKNGESDEEYAIRSLALARKVVNDEIIVAEPTPEELNTELELVKHSERIKKNEVAKKTDPKKVIYDSTQAKIDQMKSRKDLDY